MKRLAAIVAICTVAALGMEASPPARAADTILSGNYLVAAGDIACHPGNTVQVNTMQGPPYTCAEGYTGALFASGGILDTSNWKGLVPLGDEQYNYGYSGDFNDTTHTNCNTNGNNACGFYEAWGQYQPSTVIPTAGEHDWKDGDQSPNDGTGCRLNNQVYSADGLPHLPDGCGLNSYFGNNVAAPLSPGAPSNVQDGDGNGDFVYTIDPLAAHPLNLVVVNTGECLGNYGSLCAQTGAVTNWLTSALANTTYNPAKDCTVIVTALTRYSKFDHGDLGTWKYMWQAAFSPSNHGQWPDLWLSSHDHVYEDYSSGIDSSGNINTGSYSELGNYLREEVVGTGGHDLSTVDAGGHVPNAYKIDEFGDLQLGYDSTNGALSSEFWEAFPDTNGYDQQPSSGQTWNCRTS